MSEEHDEFDPLKFLYGFIAGVIFMLIIYYAEGVIQ